MTIECRSLTGSNPLGFFAALGILAAVDRQAPELEARLRWSDGVVPRAQLDGPADLAALVELLDQDRQQWATSLILSSGPAGARVDDVKPDEAGIRSWAERVRNKSTRSNRRDADLFQALMAEYAMAGNSDAKPSMLHFTAGRQQFLVMARELNKKVNADRFTEAIIGPWRNTSTLPILGWDTSGERIYALRGTKPSNDKKTGVPGTDWLAFLGITFFPSAKNGGPGRDQLLTTGCQGIWKRGRFHWPLWSVPLSVPTIRSLLAYEGLLEESVEQRALRGVFRVLEAPIRRSDQGGAGSFGPPGMPQNRRRSASSAGRARR